MIVNVEKFLESKKDYEYIRGQFVKKERGGARRSGICSRLLFHLGMFVKENSLGEIYGPDANFAIGLNYRLPDISFISVEQFPLEGEPIGVWKINPDLAVEIISPNDIYSEIEDKIYEYFEAGVKRVWIIYSKNKTLTVYRSPTNVKILTENDNLTCEELLPNFRLALKEIFKMPHPSAT